MPYLKLWHALGVCPLEKNPEMYVNTACAQDLIMLQYYSLGKNKTSQKPGSGAGKIHKSSAQKQEGKNDAYSTRARSARKAKITTTIGTK